MLPAVICHIDDQAGAAGYVLQLDLIVAAAGSPPAYTFQLHDPNDPEAHDLLNFKGDLDFTDSNHAVGVVIYLVDHSGVELQFANNVSHPTFSFAKNYNRPKIPITTRHYQIRNIQIDSSGMQVSFCYRNTQNDDDNANDHHRRSRYGIYLTDPKQNIYPIDPGVGNGSNK